LSLKQSISKLLPLGKYFLVAGTGFCVDFAIYSGLVYFGISVYLANLCGFAVGAAVNVALIRRFVFPAARFRFRADLLLTMVVNGVMLVFGMLLLWLFVEVLQINPYAAKLMANGLTFCLNYVTRIKYFSQR